MQISIPFSPPKQSSTTSLFIGSSDGQIVALAQSLTTFPNHDVFTTIGILKDHDGLITKILINWQVLSAIASWGGCTLIGIGWHNVRAFNLAQKCQE